MPQSRLAQIAMFLASTFIVTTIGIALLSRLRESRFTDFVFNRGA